MKNALKIATISALVMLSVNAMADSTGNFQWVGNIASANVTDDTIEIINSGDTNHASGTILFSETLTDSGEYNIESSSEMSFDVFSIDNDAHVDYYYTLTTLKFQAGASTLTEDIDNYFVINADGLPIDKGTKTTEIATTPTLLTLSNATPIVASLGDTVVVQATLLVSTEAL